MMITFRPQQERYPVPQGKCNSKALRHEVALLDFDGASYGGMQGRCNHALQKEDAF